MVSLRSIFNHLYADFQYLEMRIFSLFLSVQIGKMIDKLTNNEATNLLIKALTADKLSLNEVYAKFPHSS